MQIYALQLIGLPLAAIDGEIGKVKDIYFDDDTWVVRYLVIECGNWLLQRKVLISPVAVEGEKTLKTKSLQVNLNKDQVENSPDIDTDMPVSRQQESSLYNHYSWNSFGRAGMGWPTTSVVKGASALVNKEEGIHDFNPHLRSFRHVARYEIYNEEGRVGLVKDLAVDVLDWSVPYLLLDDVLTSDQERVVLPTDRIISIDCDTFQVKISLSREEMNRALRINPGGFFEENSNRLPPIT